VQTGMAVIEPISATADREEFLALRRLQRGYRNVYPGGTGGGPGGGR